MKNVRIITTARAIILNEKKELLLVSNSNKTWFTPGGWVDGFETLEETCVREVYEELGIKVKPVSLFKIDYFKLTAEENLKWKENINKIEHYFLCEMLEGKVMFGENNQNLWNDEDAGNTGFVKFFSKQEMENYNITPLWLKDII